MARIPAGIQLGRGSAAGPRRVLEAATVALSLVAAAGAWSLLRLHAVGTPAPGAAAGSVAPGPAGAPASGEAFGEASPEVLGEASVLLQSRAVGAVRAGAVFRTVRATAPAPVRIVGITIRPIGEGVAETALSARAPDSAAVADWLAALLRSPAVEAAEVISERRQRDGSVVVQVTSRITTRLPSRGDPGSGAAPDGAAGREAPPLTPTPLTRTR